MLSCSGYAESPCFLFFFPSFSFTLAVDMQPSAQLAAPSTMAKRRALPAALRIDPPVQIQQIAVALDDSDPSSADSEFTPFHSATGRSNRKNMKKLSLSLPSANSVTGSFQLPAEPQTPALSPSRHTRPRRPSVISLPPPTIPKATLLHRKEEDGGAETVPYSDGPIQVIPGIWIGSEDNARDWKGLMERGIKSILNVAKEVASPFDSLQQANSGLRTAVSTPDFRTRNSTADPTFYPAHPSSGRPAMHYLKLQWSHGQQNLVDDGFKDGMAFADAALQRGDGCLVQYV